MARPTLKDVAQLAGVILNAAKDFTVKAVLEHQPVSGFCLGNHNTNQLGVPHAQTPGVPIRYLVKLCAGFYHPALGLLRTGTLTAKAI